MVSGVRKVLIENDYNLGRNLSQMEIDYLVQKKLLEKHTDEERVKKIKDWFKF